ncbi:MAG: hypothetical protein ABF670_05440, partial [Liquorilactobacillus ghanensis]
MKVKPIKIIKNFAADFGLIFVIQSIIFWLFINLGNLKNSDLFDSKRWLFLVITSFFLSML